MSLQIFSIPFIASIIALMSEHSTHAGRMLHNIANDKVINYYQELQSAYYQPLFTWMKVTPLFFNGPTESVINKVNK